MKYTFSYEFFSYCYQINPRLLSLIFTSVMAFKISYNWLLASFFNRINFLSIGSMFCLFFPSVTLCL